MADNQALDHDTALELLRAPFNPFVHAAEDRHPWGSNHILAFGKPLLRTWDCKSGSKPGVTNSMLSRASRQRLDTHDARKKSLTTHANHADWTPTPFISFTISDTAVQELADRRKEKKNRGAQTVTAINPNVRIAKGLPILDMMTEMEYYNIPDPYGKSSSYYKDHYLCLWEVTDDEIIGHWEWELLATIDRWYESIVLPAFGEHSEKAFASLPGRGTFNMSSLLNELPETDVSDDEFSSHESRSSGDLDDSIQDQNNTNDTDDDAEEEHS